MKNNYFHPDHLGSSTVITDGMGYAYQLFLNLPFGETMAEQRRSTFNNVFKFNGKELDIETGLYYYGARYYDPRISNWLSVDPIALWQPVQESEHYILGQHNGGVFNAMNLNVYGYTYQNPIRYIDPNGKQVDVVDENEVPCLGCPGPVDEAFYGAVDFFVPIHDASRVVSGKDALGEASPIGPIELALTVITLGKGKKIWKGLGLLGRLFSKGAKTEHRIEKLLKKATFENRTKGNTSIYRIKGGLDKANEDFKKMKPKDIIDLKDKDGNVMGKEGILPDGRKIKVRNKSSDGAPTIEINKTNTKGEFRKQSEIRYDK